MTSATRHRIHKPQKCNAATFNYPPGGLIYLLKRVICHSYVNVDQRVSWSWPIMICLVNGLVPGREMLSIFCCWKCLSDPLRILGYLSYLSTVVVGYLGFDPSPCDFGTSLHESCGHRCQERRRRKLEEEVGLLMVVIVGWFWSNMAVKDAEIHTYNVNTWIHTHRYIHIRYLMRWFLYVFTNTGWQPRMVVYIYQSHF